MYLIRLLITIAVLGTCLALTVPQTRGVSATDQQFIVDAHNSYRRAVTPNATNMLEMYWNDKLASAAQYFVDKCIIGHDSNIERYLKSDVGLQVAQNMAGDDSWAEAIKGWYDEGKDYDYNTMLPKTPGREIGHYLQVVHATTPLVGCGMKECSGTNHYVCNYGAMWGETLYNSGTPCAACSDGDICDNNLCDCKGKACKHDGEIDVKTCSCTCKTGWTGDECEICPSSDMELCGPGAGMLNEHRCTEDVGMDALCPYMCGKCTST